MSLSREQILSALKPNKVEKRDLPELGGEIAIQALPAGARIEWEMRYMGAGTPDMREYLLGLVARSIVDAKGKPMFSVDEVAEWPRDAFNEASTAAMDVNGIGAKAVADAEGKSEGTELSDGAGSSLGASDTSIPT